MGAKLTRHLRQSRHVIQARTVVSSIPLILQGSMTEEELPPEFTKALSNPQLVCTHYFFSIRTLR